MRQYIPIIVGAFSVLLGCVKIYNAIQRKKDEHKIENILLSIPQPEPAYLSQPEVAPADTMLVVRIHELSDSLYSAARTAKGGELTMDDTIQVLVKLSSLVEK